MGVKFLTKEWADKVGEAASADETVKSATKGKKVVVQMTVADSPEADVFVVSINDGLVDFSIGANESSDLQIALNYATMCALAKGDLPAQTAAMTGKMKVAGDMMKIMSIGGALDELPRLHRQVGIDY
jgi:putative sterol carrier protein